jgi:hypothetical protein
VRLGRALLAFILVLAALNTLSRLVIVAQFGTTFGGNLPRFAGLAILAFTGAAYCFTTLGLFFLLDERRRRGWWLALGLLPVAVLNGVAPVVLIAEEHIGIALVLDVYLVNGLLPLAVICFLLRRSAREFFGVSRARLRSIS